MKPANDIETQAADWLAQLARASFGEPERAAFDRWLAADPKHLAAYERLGAVWQRMDRLQSLGFQRAHRPDIVPSVLPREAAIAAASRWQRIRTCVLRLFGSR